MSESHVQMCARSSEASTLASEERSEATRINKRSETGESDTILHIGLVLCITGNDVCEAVRSQSPEQPVQNRGLRRRSIHMCDKGVLIKINMVCYATILLRYAIYRRLAKWVNRYY